MSALGVLFFSSVKAVGELGVNVVFSGVLEGLFPPANPYKNPWLSLFEGVMEIGAHLLLVGTVANSWNELFLSNELVALPYGSLLMFWLLEGGVQKVGFFVSYIKARMNASRLQHAAKDASPIPVESQA